jgi:hypothetical protein
MTAPNWLCASEEKALAISRPDGHLVELATPGLWEIY